MTRKRVEIREGSLGYPGFVKPVFTKDSKTPRENITRASRDCDTHTHLKKVTPLRRCNWYIVCGPPSKEGSFHSIDNKESYPFYQEKKKLNDLSSKRYAERNSNKIWWNNLKDLPMWPRRKAVAEFRLTT
ncbi:hypothetical protein TNCV_1612251 [Trichonephila clavipes]|nr:hypothetical protein TNCV_1612251 [Trichonephila clavipes]